MTRQSSLALARLGLPALPLAFVALPLYMVWPHHVATSFGLSLGLLGGLLFVVRLLDGLLDPLIGHAVDGLLNKGGTTLLRRCLLAGLVLALSFIWLFFPQWLLGPTLTMDALLVLLSVLLLCAYLAYSFLNIALQAWGAGIAGDHTERSRLVGWREGLGLLGVISASVLPGLWGLPVLVTVFVLLLALGLWAWWWAPRPTVVAAVNSGSLWRQLLLPWGHAGFRRLLQVFMLNGIASAVPATLILFFVQDRLQMSNAQTTVFVAAYFIAAALSMPLWLRAMARWGLRRCWLWGMGLAIAVFICWFGFYIVQPNQGKVMQFFGSYSGTDRNAGLRWDVGVTSGFNLNNWDSTSGDGKESPLGAIHQEGQLAKTNQLSAYGAVSWISGGDHRLAILVTGSYFVIGLVLLAGVDARRGRHAALEG